MKLTKTHWEKEDIEEFRKYLKSFSKGEKSSLWEQKITNTSLPCLAVPSKTVDIIIKEIHKGNFMEFIDFWTWENLTETIILGNLICKIKDFEIFEKYLGKFANNCDNWASVDTLKFNITKDNENKFFILAKRYLKSEKEFVRRTGFRIFFKFINKKYLDEIFEIINTFKEEKCYYVNMVISWLIAECFIKEREKTLQFLQNHNLNKFTVNKTISKCRDSFRVSKEDKEMLLQFRKK